MRSARCIALLSFLALSFQVLVAGQSTSEIAPTTSPSSTIPTGIISIVAGTGKDAFSGDGGPATSAGLNWPNGVAVDSAGDIYIADTDSSVIRLVTRSSGTISTFAGEGLVSGFYGDGGYSFTAELSYPKGVAVDRSGNVFVADTENCAIRKIDIQTYVITTVAGQGGSCGHSGDGGLAVAAQLHYPTGIAVDAAGDLFIADSVNNSIRRVNSKNGVISTIAGQCGDIAPPYCEGGLSGDGGLATKATLSGPVAVALDSSSNVYIADKENNRIRSIDAKTGIIKTIAGNCKLNEVDVCPSGYTPDGGLATNAALSEPQGVAIDPFGNVVFSDSDNDLVRKVDAKTGILTTVAGLYGWIGIYHNDGPADNAALQNPTQLTFDSSGNLYIADNADQVIREVTGSTTPAAITPVIEPSGGIFASPTNVTMKDSSPGSKIYYTLDGSVPTTESAVYSAPVKLTSSATVLAFATAPGLVNSAAAVATFEYEVPAPAPIVYPPAGTYKTPVQFNFSDSAKTTGDYLFYYTLDGTTPTTKSTEFRCCVSLNESTTLKVIAVVTGYLPSPVSTAVFTINLPGLPAPTFSRAAGTYFGTPSVAIADSNSSAVFYYTLDGTTPTENSERYYSPITITQSTTLKAIASEYGYADSKVASAVYSIQLPAPTFSLKAGTYTGNQSTTITDSAADVLIYYTLDGSSPTTASKVYSGQISVSESANLKAIAVEKDFANSAITSALYTIQLPSPVFSLKAGTYTGNQPVIITDSIAGALFYYTLDGSSPSTASKLYSGPVFITKSESLKAIAIKKDLANSAITSALYTIQLPAPVFSLKPGTYAGTQYVKLSDSTGGASIHYTLNGTTPGSSSPVLASTAALSITKTTTVRAIAIETDYVSSAVSSATYALLPPPVEVTGAATNIGANSATLNGTVDSKGAPATWCFIYGTRSTVLTGKTTLETLAAGDAAVSTSASLTGLASGKEYYFQIIAKSAAGATKGQVHTFTTK